MQNEDDWIFELALRRQFPRNSELVSFEGLLENDRVVEAMVYLEVALCSSIENGIFEGLQSS